MELETVKMCMKTVFIVACLLSMVAARMEMKQASPAPEEMHTQKVKQMFREQPWCPDGWLLNLKTNSCFRKMLHAFKHTAAQEYCRSKGGALATVTDQELQYLLSQHVMATHNAWNTTEELWVGYMLVKNTGASGAEGSSIGANDTVTWQVNTEETTGPEPLVDNSASIPTAVPEGLTELSVVCIQLKLVYVGGYLKKWGWNLARCEESSTFICKKGASRSCYDWKANLVSEGSSFTPPGHDSCTVCTCLQGVPNVCRIASCAPPACPNFKPNPEACCKYTCLENDPNVPSNNDNPEALMSENMRWVLTMITSFLLLGMMLFMVYRMRQKRIAYLRYRIQQLRDGQEGEFEPGSGPPPAPAMDDIDGQMYQEPPPPYSFFKDSDHVEMPPPYHVQQTASHRIGRQDVNHNRDSRSSDQPDNVMLLPGSEPTTPSDISTISTLASLPPYNRMQSTDSAPMTPPESTPMLQHIGTRHPSRASPSSPAIRNTTV